MKNKKTWIYIGVYLGITLLVLFVYYLALPAINPQTPEFWLFLTFMAFVYMVPFAFRRKEIEEKNRSDNRPKMFIFPFKARKFLIFAIAPLVISMLGGFASSTFFNARSYANVISVEERVFKDDMPETENVTNVALMDSETARVVGSRSIGNLSDVISQYVISNDYNQINYQKKPQKVANLEYDGFFKWAGNRSNGIPGYVIVDPVAITSKYVKLAKPMKYAESGYFGDDLYRKLRFSYPTKIFGSARYEIDEEGNPVYVVPCMRPRVFMFGAMDVYQVVLFDPCTGNSKLYAVDDVPTWVDIVYDGHLASQKYNWHGTLSRGWFNSKIGNKDCKRTTDDFGYIALGDDVWYYTGVTSVTSDMSNIGFILTNARTGEYKFYPVVGAEEHSAMAAAEGEVQEKGYVASFPVLINVKGQATYIMVLKDNAQLVKLYALVNVENYSVVATGDTQEEAMKAYKKLLAEKGIIGNDQDGEEKFTIDILSVTNTGTVFYYEVFDGEKTVFYKINLHDDESAIFIKTGDKLEVTRSQSGTENIFNITSWKKVA